MEQPHNQLTVGVVVPVYNDWNNLQKCLAALANLKYPKELLKIRVVDNGSNDWPNEVDLPSNIEVFKYKIPGSYGARNRAAKKWDVDVLAFTDSDCAPEKSWADEGIKKIAGSKKKIIVAGKIIIKSKKKTATLGEQYDQILGFDQERTVRRSHYGATANLFVPASIFEQLGGFNEETKSGGDREFCERANQEGISIGYASNAIVLHPARDFKELARKQKRIIGGKIILNKHKQYGSLRALLASLRPIFFETLRIMGAKEILLFKRLALVLIALTIRLIVIAEWIRIYVLGGQPLR